MTYLGSAHNFRFHLSLLTWPQCFNRPSSGVQSIYPSQLLNPWQPGSKRDRTN